MKHARRSSLAVLAFAGTTLSCALGSGGDTLAHLRDRDPDLEDARVEHGLAQAIEGYQQFLDEAPTSRLTPEAMRRLADLKLESRYGTLAVDSSPEAASLPASASEPLVMASRDSMADVESRATGLEALPYAETPTGLPADGDRISAEHGPLDAIALYDEILEKYPGYAQNDQVLYQKARAFDELGRVDEAVEVAAQLIERHPTSRHVDELQFRRGEYFFTRKKYLDAEESYQAVASRGPSSEYYELAVYKLGWSFYKQMMLEEALDSYFALLDYKVSTGYDFDQTSDENDAQRVDDTFRVASLCFSELGGPDAVTRFLARSGTRPYESRIYRQLGEFYLEKLRYHDSALAYKTFVERNPDHPAAPGFSMRVVEVYEAGNFGALVLEAKKDFAIRYAVDSERWAASSGVAPQEVLVHLKRNLHDLATHYHALYQAAERPDEQPGHYEEASRWYGDYLRSFAGEPETPEIHHRYADLLLENRDFDDAAIAYEKIAYGYAAHAGSDAAGFAAVFARREGLKIAAPEVREDATRRVVETSLRFAGSFPDHEEAPPVMAAAAEDLYRLGDLEGAIQTGSSLIERYPEAGSTTLRSAWTVVAFASFDRADFVAAEKAYLETRSLIPAEDPALREINDNLAASIYKQGEAAREAGEHRLAADHFLRIAGVAPESEIRALSEYDAAAALMEGEDWSAAAEILEAFRREHPDHELNREATRQLAFAYRQADELERAALEYERVAKQADAVELRMESLLVAGSLHEEVGNTQQALAAYGRYVTEFTDPLDQSVATRFKMANLYEQMGEDDAREAELRRIVSIDATAGDGRTPAVRGFGARAALLLAEPAYAEFAGIQLTQPFEASLKRKKKGMARAIAAFEELVEYGVAEVTAATTYYLAEIYGEFGRALLESERPDDLTPGELQDYVDVIEEEAYPFEEKAIAIHEKNLELVSGGIFNDWVEKSVGRLGVLMPGRYAKVEVSVGPMSTINFYAYRAPSQSGEPGSSPQPAESIEPGGESLASNSFQEDLAMGGAGPDAGSNGEEKEVDSSSREAQVLAEDAYAPGPAAFDPNAGEAETIGRGSGGYDETVEAR